MSMLNSLFGAPGTSGGSGQPSYNSYGGGLFPAGYGAGSPSGPQFMSNPNAQAQSYNSFAGYPYGPQGQGVPQSTPTFYYFDPYAQGGPAITTLNVGGVAGGPTSAGANASPGTGANPNPVTSTGQPINTGQTPSGGMDVFGNMLDPFGLFGSKGAF